MPSCASKTAAIVPAKTIPILAKNMVSAAVSGIWSAGSWMFGSEKPHAIPGMKRNRIGNISIIRVDRTRLRNTLMTSFHIRDEGVILLPPVISA